MFCSFCIAGTSLSDINQMRLTSLSDINEMEVPLDCPLSNMTSFRLSISNSAFKKNMCSKAKKINMLKKNNDDK